MGRKRRNRDKVGDADAKKSALYREDLLEVLSCINEMGGVTAAASSSREELALRRRMILNLNSLQESLATLSRFDSRNGSSYDRPPPVQEDVALLHQDWEEQRKDDNRFILLEEAAAQIRSTCNELIEVFAKERAELFQLCREMESLCCEHVALDSAVAMDPLQSIQASLFVRSIASQYRAQLQLEENIVSEVVVFLSKLYDGENDSASEKTQRDSKMIVHWAQVLDKRIHLDRLQWNHLSSLIETLQTSSSASFTYSPLLQPMLPSPLNENNYQDVSPADIRYSSIKDCIVAEDTVSGAVDVFLKKEEVGCLGKQDAGLTLMLLVGNAGSGKTHVCDQIERKISDANATGGEKFSDSIQLIRPSLPLDMMGSSVGETEDIIVSLFGFAQDANKKCVIIFDDIEYILGDSFAAPMGLEDLSSSVDGGESHVTVRARSTVLSILNVLRSKSDKHGQSNMLGRDTLVICTARHTGDDMLGQFDKVFVLGPPDERERKSMISSCLGVDTFQPSGLSRQSDEVDTLLTDLAESTVGRSYAEIAQYCRGVCSVARNTGYEFTPATEAEGPQRLQVLRAMQESLRNVALESLRSGSLDEFVDMRVFSARELLPDHASSLQKGPLPLPLFGNDAKEAWRQMDGLVVTPLCRARALDKIMFGGSQKTGRTVCAGVLLTGPPGCGKSALALHCAKVAASMLPSVSLLDVSCTSLVHKEVGGSERAVQRLFSAARAAAPCILLMDGIENIAAVRGNDNTTEGTMDRVLSTLLIELDGIDSDLDSSGSVVRASGGIAVIGITHNPSWIDPALRRPGRLEKVIRLTHPDHEATRSIVLNEIERLPIVFSPSSTSEPSSLRTRNDLAEYIASQCHYMSAAEVIALCSEACVISARKHLNLETTSAETQPITEVEDFLSAIGVRRHGASS